MTNLVDNRPSGLGVWVAFHGMAKRPLGKWGPTVLNMKQLGFDWVAIRAGQGGSRQGDFLQRDLTEVAEACKDHGVRLLTWTYSYPEHYQKEAELIATLIEQGSQGHIIDGEYEWELPVDRKVKALNFGERLRKLVGYETYIAHSPLAYRNYHPYPYTEFNTWVDQIMPQTYWTELVRGNYDEQFVKMLDSWDSPPYTNNDPNFVAPIGVTYGHAEINSATKPPGFFFERDLDRFLGRYKGKKTLSLYSWEASSKEAIRYLEKRKG